LFDSCETQDLFFGRSKEIQYKPNTHQSSKSKFQKHTKIAIDTLNNMLSCMLEDVANMLEFSDIDIVDYPIILIVDQ